MNRKFNNLGFVIGLFFIIVSLILLIGRFFSVQEATKLNLYTGILFLVFGILMGKFSKDESSEEP